jgi:hypothetical protein
MKPLDRSRLTKMRIPFEKPDDSGCIAECLWVTILENEKYRIENYPLSVNLNYRDIVRAIVIDGVLTFERLVIRSGEKRIPLRDQSLNGKS